MTARLDGLVLLAGGSGTLGRHAVRALRARGSRVRVLSRRGIAALPDDVRADPGVEAFAADLLRPRSLAGCFEGIDAVVSCLGASLDLYAWRERLPYWRIDRDCNLALLGAAREAGVRRFAYVSVFGGPAIDGTAYVDAHRSVDRALEASGMEHRILRPTGFFGFLDELVRMAARGFVPVIGDGSARTNPVDERDLAGLVAGAFDEPASIVEIGGPDVYSRREIALLAAAAVRRPVRVVSSPPGLWRTASRVLAGVQPRVSQLLEFAAVVSTTTAVAPRRGQRRLEDHFRAVAERAATRS